MADGVAVWVVWAEDHPGDSVPPCVRAVKRRVKLGQTMVWLTLANWALVAVLALCAGSVPLPSLLTHLVVVLGGLGTMVAFAAGNVDALAWISFALACAGTLLLAGGAHTLVEDADDTMGMVGQSHKETVAGVVGLELPLLAVTGLLSLAVAATA